MAAGRPLVNTFFQKTRLGGPADLCRRAINKLSTDLFASGRLA
jgi:hypothetical protein